MVKGGDFGERGELGGEVLERFGHGVLGFYCRVLGLEGFRALEME